MTSYFYRLRFYFCLSFLIHGLALSILGTIPIQTRNNLDNPEGRVIDIKFEPREIEKHMKKLVEVQEPSVEKPQQTDNIAEQNSIATGPNLIEGDSPGPVNLERSEFDRLEKPPSQIKVANVVGNTRGKIQEKQSSLKKEISKPELDRKKQPVDSLVEESSKTNSSKEGPIIDSQNPDISDENEGKMAELDKTYALYTQKRSAEGRVYNQIKKEGVLGFDALQDEIAPYLKEIRRKVERNWIHLLLTRYSGMKPTEVVIDCEISQDGKLVRLEGVGLPDDPFFLSLCKQALNKASPFPPFPFSVPDFYQDKNLKIRWTFSFMK